MINNKQKALFYSSNKRSLYLGRMEPVLTRVNVASTLLVSLDKPVSIIDTDEKAFTSHSFLIPAGQKVTINTNNAKVALCSLDDLGTDLQRLIPKMRQSLSLKDNTRVYSNVMCEKEMIVSATKLWESRASTEIALAEIDSWVNYLNKEYFDTPDSRIVEAVSIIKTHCTENISVNDIAREVNLSTPRLTQLFREVTGTPIRRFRLWHRIQNTAERVHNGESMTDAAISAGFSDYAQFSRVFKELWGSNPSKAKNNIEIRLLAS